MSEQELVFTEVMTPVKDDAEMLSLLEKGLQRLRTPGVWCQKDYFRNWDGQREFAEDKAHFFCMLGACGYPTYKSQGSFKQRTYRIQVMDLLRKAIQKITGKDRLASVYNDDEERTLPEVILVVETAIQMVKNGEYHVPVR